MPDDKPLPRPPKTPFGRRVASNADEETTLLADKLQQAMLEGRIDEFFDKEFGVEGHQRKMAELMMGMMGMSPGSVPASSMKPERGDKTDSPTFPNSPAMNDPSAVSSDVVKAAGAGDVAGLMSLLAREQAKRAGQPTSESAQPRPSGGQPASEQTGPSQPSHMEQATLDALLQISRDNQVSMDWLIARAVKLYVRDHGRTGRL